jgi:hypothetical protein
MQVTPRASFHFPFIFQLEEPANLLSAAVLARWIYLLEPCHGSGAPLWLPLRGWPANAILYGRP